MWDFWRTWFLRPREVKLELVFDRGSLTAAEQFYGAWCDRQHYFTVRLGSGQPAATFDQDESGDELVEYFLYYPPIEESRHWVLGDDGETDSIIRDKASGQIFLRSDLSVVGMSPYVHRVSSSFAEFLTRINWNQQLRLFN